MQEIWNFLIKYAGIVAFLCALGAAYYVANAYRSRREARSAMFDAERQVAQDRVMRNGLVGMILLVFTIVFFGLSLIGTGSAAPSETPTRAPATRTLTPRASATGPITPTRQLTPQGPTLPPPPTLTATTPPVNNTPVPGSKTRVVTGTADSGGLALRKTPSGDLIDRLPDGTVVELVGDPQTVGGQEWQKVRDPQGREGWVASQYLIVKP